jgi:hypoxanthine-DNA glycosylase
LTAIGFVTTISKIIKKEDSLMDFCKCIDPVIAENSTILILGSMPGVKSLQEQQYYAHPQNRFWEIMGSICNEPKLTEFDYETKLKTLLQNKIALWDIIDTCERKGSSDSSIKNENPNNIREFLDTHTNIKMICFNGKNAYETFEKHYPDLLIKYTWHLMKSTSGSNNANFNQDEWIEILATR